jgi:hypothetical protein
MPPLQQRQKRHAAGKVPALRSMDGTQEGGQIRAPAESQNPSQDIPAARQSEDIHQHAMDVQGDAGLACR